MPTYDYQCESCKNEFSVVRSISEYGKMDVTCPRCKSNDVRQLISTFMVKTSRKS
ncbi:MAG: zinc ribbon domain-containing protein [Syntrophales bacterium]